MLAFSMSHNPITFVLASLRLARIAWACCSTAYSITTPSNPAPTAAINDPGLCLTARPVKVAMDVCVGGGVYVVAGTSVVTCCWVTVAVWISACVAVTVWISTWGDATVTV